MVQVIPYQYQTGTVYTVPILVRDMLRVLVSVLLLLAC